MKLVRTPGKCPAKLQACDVKRVPKHRQYLAGYYIGCPACGWVTIVPFHQGDFVEDDVAGEERLTMKSPQTCDRPSCRKVFTIHEDEFRLHDDC